MDIKERVGRKWGLVCVYGRGGFSQRCVSPFCSALCGTCMSVLEKGREGKERKGKGKREKERRKMGDKKDKNSSCISSMITLTHTRDYKKRIVVLHPEFLPFLRYIFPFSILFAMYHCSSALSSVFFSFSVFFIFFYFIFFYFFFFNFHCSKW
mmetsp:Transcript_45227/g.117074  ORF Transcript_45227/g.117074 Transcript_45227/m.117074 type:complete len:153 (+) Transcript_45227:1166-1624(+)